MARNHFSEEEGEIIEGKLKAYFQAQADEHRAPADLWARLEPRLEKPSGEGRHISIWQRLTSPKGRGPLVAAAAVVLLLVVSGTWLLTAGPWQKPAPLPAPPAPLPAPAPMPVPRPAPAPGFSIKGPEGPAGAAGPLPIPAPAPRPAPAPAPAPPPIKQGKAPAAVTDESALVGQAWAVERMIIRNGTLSLVVQDTPRAIDQAAQLAKDMGGYVVSSRTWQEGKKVAGTITIRVPAELFTDAVRALKAMAVEVVTEDATSQDVTEEYVDLSSRLRSLEATEEQLLKIMKSATEVQDVLAVQRELTRVQGEIEQTKGRMQYLERSSATSLIRITLREVGLDIRILPSTRKARVGEDIRLNAQVSGGFSPYSYQWNLGDGTTSTEESPEHAYGQAGKFDLSLTITDDKGNTATEVEKAFITVAPMEARFDASRTEIKEGEEIRFFSEVAGGFPPYSYQWNLGDGTTSTERNPRHIYSDAGRYTVSLTISDDKGNTASETRKKGVTVTAPPAWSAGKQATGALRALSTFGRWLGTGLIWMAVFIPVWGLIIGLIIAGGILRRRRA